LNVTMVGVAVEGSHPNLMQILYPDQGRTRSLYVYHEQEQEIISWYNAIRGCKYYRYRVSLLSPEELLRLPLTYDFAVCGWLAKTGPNQTEAWQRRWCFLLRRSLFYCAGFMEPRPRGEIWLGQRPAYSVSAGPPPGFRKKVKPAGQHVFTLSTPDRDYVFSADSAAACQQWLTAIDNLLDSSPTPQDCLYSMTRSNCAPGPHRSLQPACTPSVRLATPQSPTACPPSVRLAHTAVSNPPATPSVRLAHTAVSNPPATPQCAPGPHRSLQPACHPPSVRLAHTAVSNPRLAAQPPLLVLHGLFGMARNWRSVAKALARNHSPIICADLRNHGDSPHHQDMSVAAMVGDVRQFIEQQLDATPVHLLGHSLGGKVAMRTALLHPQLVRSLIVVDASRRSPAAPSRVGFAASWS
uniref:sn-1-specific diacylglycerol lipase ABHD11 n=1 Tax=Macrostomum lignano TaxID=282301 RepID=A0A1I8JSG0_9PLAT